ncbi:MAG: 6-bladed beta-propeller [Acidobacteriota bacterium]
MRGALALLLLAAIGCATQPLEEWTLGLEEELTIGAEPLTLQTAFYMPVAMGFDFRGNVYVLDAGNHRVQVFLPDGTFLRTLGGPGEGPGELQDPNGMFVHGDGRVWVADTRGRRIQPYAADGRPLPPLTLELFPLDLVVAADRIFVQRLPQTNLMYGPDPAPLIAVLDSTGNITGGFIDPVESSVGILYMLENMMAMASDPGGGIGVVNTHFASLLRRYEAGGELLGETPVLYKAQAFAPLGRRPTQVNEASLGRIARTASDLAWDEGRRLYWVLAGYVDQTPEGQWIVGREVYRYAPSGEYRGSVMLPQQATSLAIAPDGRLWTMDIDGVAHGFRVTDPETAPG